LISLRKKDGTEQHINALNIQVDSKEGAKFNKLWDHCLVIK